MRIVSFRGRIGRSDYFLASIMLLVISAVAVVLLEVGAPNAGHDFPKKDIPDVLLAIKMPVALGWTCMLAGFAVLIYVALGGISISVRRLHDFGLTGFLVLLYPVLEHVIPDQHWPDWVPGPASLLWDLIMIAQPGTRGPNAFGADPRAVPADVAPAEAPETRPD